MSAIPSTMISNSLPLPESAGSSRLSQGNTRGPDAAAKVAHEFESVFASTMLKEMRQSLEPGSLFGEDSGDVYGGLFDRFMGDQLTKGPGLRMARMVQASIEKLQHAGQPGLGSSSPGPACVPTFTPTAAPAVPASASPSITG